jgi:protein TonB
VALSTPRPNYPSKAAQNNISGYVVVEFDVLTDGSVKNPKVIDSEPNEIFDKQALISVRKYKFEPVSEKIRVRQKVKFSTKS